MLRHIHQQFHALSKNFRDQILGKTNNLPPGVIQNIFWEHANNIYPDFRVYHRSRYNTESGVACACVGDETVKSYTLPVAASVLTTQSFKF